MRFMYYVYILESQRNGKNYTGFTNDLRRRIKEHNSKIGSAYTKKNGPFKLIYYEAYLDKKDAMRSEKFYKTGYGREILRDKLGNFIIEHKLKLR